MPFLAKALFQWNESSKNADISILSNFLAISFEFFLHIKKFYQVLSTCQFQINWAIQTEITEPPLTIPIYKKPGLFGVKNFPGEHAPGPLEGQKNFFSPRKIFLGQALPPHPPGTKPSYGPGLIKVFFK